jgi:hypothetical protein
VQLDKTRIRIRERSYLEILDLALRVVRACFGPLVISLVVGILPMFLLNAYLFSDMAEGDIEFPEMLPQFFLLVMVILWEIPLATAPATLYLGQVVFEERPSAPRIASDFVRSLPQLIFYQVLVRAVLIWPIITWLWLFTQYAFLNEVILLERNPMRQRSPSKPSTGRRCRTLHSGVGGIMLTRAMGSGSLAILLTCSVGTGIQLFGSLFLSELDLSGAMFVHCFQAAAWIAVGFFCVVRFLSYLDLRIRREGWEVELVMRAESEALAGPAWD